MDSTLTKDDNYYPEVFLKKSKYNEKKVVRCIHDNLSIFSYSCDESDEAEFKAVKRLKIKAKRLMVFENTFFEREIF